MPDLSYRVNNTDPTEKKRFIQRMFNAIVPTYDLLNRVLSLGIDRSWRSFLVKQWGDVTGKPVLDLCCGTGDLSLQLYRAGADLVSLDFSLPMLIRGRDKAWLCSSIVCADAVQLPFKDSSFFAASIAFGIRNIPDIDLFMNSVFRVLKPGGVFSILELTRPRNPLVRMAYGVYLRALLPLVGGLVSRKWTAYRYLSQTIATFLDPRDLEQRLRASGFDDVAVYPLTLGIATVIECRKGE